MMLWNVWQDLVSVVDKELSFDEVLATLSCWLTVACRDGPVRWIVVNKFNVCTFTRLNVSIEHVKFCMHFYNAFMSDFLEQLSGMDVSDIEMIFECAVRLELEEVASIVEPMRGRHAEPGHWRHKQFR